MTTLEEADNDKLVQNGMCKSLRHLELEQIICHILDNRYCKPSSNCMASHNTNTKLLPPQSPCLCFRNKTNLKQCCVECLNDVWLTMFVESLNDCRDFVCQCQQRSTHKHEILIVMHFRGQPWADQDLPISHLWDILRTSTLHPWASLGSP